MEQILGQGPPVGVRWGVHETDGWDDCGSSTILTPHGVTPGELFVGYKCTFLGHSVVLGRSSRIRVSIISPPHVGNWPNRFG